MQRVQSRSPMEGRFLACACEAALKQTKKASDRPSADARQCGDACRTARGAVPNGGTIAPACGCTGDAECGKSFCALGGACATTDRGLVLTECKALQAKGLKPTENLQGASCWGLEGLRCDAIKTLKLPRGGRIPA